MGFVGRFDLDYNARCLYIGLFDFFLTEFILGVCSFFVQIYKTPNIEIRNMIGSPIGSSSFLQKEGRQIIKGVGFAELYFEQRNILQHTLNERVKCLIIFGFVYVMPRRGK